MDTNGNRVWDVAVREVRDWSVTVHERDLDLPSDASDDAVEEAVAERADRMVADRHRDATRLDANRDILHTEQQA